LKVAVVNLKLELAINTQTPLIRFKLSFEELLEKYGKLEEPVDLENLAKDEDYYFAPGGVTAMVYPMVKELMSTDELRSACWVSLNPNAPSEALFEGIKLYHVQLPNELIPYYTSFKENIWRECHGLGWSKIKVKEYEAYMEYNWLCAQRMLRLLPEVDLLWVHDFQQLQVGGFIGPSAPTVFRWHIPFKVDLVSPRMRDFVLRSFEGYDAVVVSTRRDLEGLVHGGYRGRAYQIYPYIDPRKWYKPSNEEIKRVSEKYGIKEDHELVLVVARMDYVKRQDVAIKSHALLRKRRPNTVLMLVGDGSFTSSGLGHSKGEQWRRYLVSLARELRVEDSVLFSGYVNEEELRALYARADAVLLPSMMEGFGLTVVEAWALKKPVIVSKGAGVSELVIEGVNGFTHKPEDHEELSSKVAKVLEDSEEAAKMGELGYETSKRCWVTSAKDKLKEVFEDVIKGYEEP